MYQINIKPDGEDEFLLIWDDLNPIEKRCLKEKALAHRLTIPNYVSVLMKQHLSHWADSDDSTTAK